MEVSSLGTNAAFSGHWESTVSSPQGRKSNKQALLAHLFLQLSDGGCYSQTGKKANQEAAKKLHKSVKSNEIPD